MSCKDCREPLTAVVLEDPQIGRVRAWICMPCAQVLPPIGAKK